MATVVVTISGLPGAGTSTVASQVAARLGVSRVDGGTMFRAMAVERGLDLSDFGAEAEADPAIDVELDRRLGDVAVAGDVVVESRLAGWIAVDRGIDALKVWIVCDDAERARRVGVRDGVGMATAVAANQAREASEARRYRTYYGIELADLSPYDLLLDSTATPPGELVEAIVAAASR